MRLMNLPGVPLPTLQLIAQDGIGALPWTPRQSDAAADRSCRSGRQFATPKRLRVTAALLLATGAVTAGELQCTSINSTNFAIVNFDIEYVAGSTFPDRMYVTIRNHGPGMNQDFLYYDIYELDAQRNRIAHIKRVNTSTVVMLNSQVLRTITFVPGLIRLGTEYEAVLVYSCELDTSDNVAFQHAFSIGAPPDVFFRNGFEAPQVAALEQP